MALYWTATSGPVGQEVSLLSPGQQPIRQRAAALDPADLVYPAPGGGLLRVPVGGGAAAPVQGTIAGQLVWWDAAAGQWRTTTTGPADGQSPAWNAAANEYQWTSSPTPPAPPLQTQIGWTPTSGSSSNVLTLMAAPHTAGMYQLAWATIVRTSAVGSSMFIRLLFTSPQGPENQIVASTMIWNTLGTNNIGNGQTRALQLVSTGVAPITIQWSAGSFSSGPPVADLYAIARLIGA